MNANLQMILCSQIMHENAGLTASSRAVLASVLELLAELDDVENDISGYRLRRPTPKGSSTESLEDTETKMLLKKSTVSLTLRLSVNRKNTI